MLVADDVYLQDGKHLIGTVSDETDENLMLKTNEGTFIVNKSNVIHIERNEPNPEAKKGLKSIAHDLFTNIQNIKLRDVRHKVKLVHLKIFQSLDRIGLYKRIINYPSIAKYKRENRAAYLLGVYMSLLLLLGVSLNIVKSIFLTIYCRLFNIKQKFDL